jgi:hypothetical protein
VFLFVKWFMQHTTRGWSCKCQLFPRSASTKQQGNQAAKTIDLEASLVFVGKESGVFFCTGITGIYKAKKRQATHPCGRASSQCFDTE